MASPDSRPELIPIETLSPDPRNANLGTDRGREALLRALRTHGAGRSILLDRLGRIVAGNKTWAAAQEAGVSDVLVVPSDGTRLVAVQRTDLDLDTPEGRLAALEDNQIGALDLSWDASVISEALADGIDLSHLWIGDEFERLLGELPGTDEWDNAFAASDGAAPGFMQMTFTLTAEQAEAVQVALKTAKGAGPFVETGNENSNGNALARICEAYGLR